MRRQRVLSRCDVSLRFVCTRPDPQALADPWQSEAIEQAHARAVERSVAYLREQLPVVRRRYGGPVIEETARQISQARAVKPITAWTGSSAGVSPALIIAATFASVSSRSASPSAATQLIDPT